MKRIALLVVLATACTIEDPEVGNTGCESILRTRPREPPNVVLVVADTVRRDRVGAYGGPARTPHFDTVASEGWRFDRAVSTAPWTKPAMASLFTGLPAASHGMTSHPALQLWAGEKMEGRILHSDVLSEEFMTLAEAYRAAGHRTGAFVSNPWLDRRFGLAQGFETYVDQAARFDANGAILSRMAMNWVDALPPGERFFLYVHYIDAHRPFHPIPAARVAEERARLESDRRPISEQTLSVIRRFVRAGGDYQPPPSLALLELAYDRGVEIFDDALGILLDRIARRSDWNETLLVVTADHGEALYARGYGNHGKGLFDDELAIPLAIRGPGLEPKVVSCPVSLIDLMPTLCGWSGLDCPGGLAGRDWSSPSPRGAGPDYLVSEGVPLRPRNRAVRDARFKLLHEPEGSLTPIDPDDPWRLYDLARDPDEEHDLLEGPLGFRAAAIRKRLAAALANRPVAPPVDRTEKAVVDEELIEQLRRLGYVDAEDGVATGGEPTEAGPRP